MRVYASLLFLSVSCSAYVNADSLPSFLNSNETLRNLPTPNLPADAFRPVSPKLQLPVPASTQGQPLLMGTQVTVRKIRIEGGTIYSLKDLGEAYQPFIGKSTSLAELIEATRSLTQRYQRDGYLLSYAFLPPQNFDNGLVRVVLVEGYIRDYQLQGDVGPVSAYLDTLVNKLKAERPLTRKTFERYTTLMSKVPGITLQAQVPPPGTTDGASTLIVQAQRKPWDASLLSLTDGDRDGLQALLGVSSNAQTALAEQVTLSGLFPPGEEREHYYRLDYSQYLNDEGTQLNLYGSTYRSDPSTDVLLDNGLELKSHQEENQVSIGVSHPLIAAPTQWLSVAARLYAVDDTTDYQALNAPMSLSSRTDVRALALESDWRDADDRQLRILSAGVYQGINGLGAKTDSSDYDLDFLRLRVSGVQSNRYFDNWQGVASAAFYWSNDSLPDSERAVFGGQNFGRGYPSDQASGDKGWGVAYELNYSFKRDGEWLKVVQPYAVLDAAHTWFNELPFKGADLSSFAVGLRLGEIRHYNISFEAAKPMSDIAQDSFNRQVRYSVNFSHQI